MACLNNRQVQKIVLDLAKNYVDAFGKHTAKDTLVSMEDIRSLEPMLYDHTAALVRIFALGSDIQGERDKIIQALKPVFCGVSPMSGEAKDNKTGWNPLTGPPKQPLFNGNIGKMLPWGS